MRPVGSPATHGERSFGAFLGLVAVRALTHVPFVYLWLRPFVAVAAARIVAGHDARARLGGAHEGSMSDNDLRASGGAAG